MPTEGWTAVRTAKRVIQAGQILPGFSCGREMVSGKKMVLAGKSASDRRMCVCRKKT